METKQTTAIGLKTVNEISDAYEWLFNAQKEGKIDAKTADALNTTLKGLTYLCVKLRMDAAKLMIQAQMKKVNIPENLLPPMS